MIINDMKIWCLEDSLKPQLLCLDRSWFTNGDILYYKGEHPIHILGLLLESINEKRYYIIEEHQHFTAGDWFTLEKEKQPEVIKKQTVTIEIKITFDL